MPVNWTLLQELQTAPSGRIEARVRLDPASFWFSGHFPIKPIFPGVAMLGLVEEMVRQMAKSGHRKMELLGFNRVRFKSLAFPGQQLLISVPVLPEKTEAGLTFEISRDKDPICQGQILIRLV